MKLWNRLLVWLGLRKPYVAPDSELHRLSKAMLTEWAEQDTRDMIKHAIANMDGGTQV